MAKSKAKPEKVAVDSSPLAAHPRWLGLLVAGDNRTARAEAAKALEDPSTSEQEKAAAREVLQRTGLEPVVLSVGMIGLAVVLVLIALLFF